jgi:hypothetical protein
MLMAVDDHGARCGHWFIAKCLGVRWIIQELAESVAAGTLQE